MSSKEKSNSNDSEELEAAFTLVRMKTTTLNEQEKANLHKLKASFSCNPVREVARAITQNSSTNSALDNDYKPPDFPPVVQELREKIRSCSKPMEKTLTKADLNPSQCRLFMNKRSVSEILETFLSKDERRTLEKDNQVTIYDLKGNKYPMSFRFWADKYYVLTTIGWTKFHRDNRLTDKHRLTLWMFKHAKDPKLKPAKDPDFGFVISWRRVASN